MGDRAGSIPVIRTNEMAVAIRFAAAFFLLEMLTRELQIVPKQWYNHGNAKE